VTLTFAAWLAALGGRRRDHQDKSHMLPLLDGMIRKRNKPPMPTQSISVKMKHIGKDQKRGAFTLIELLVVIASIATVL
jgi:prepilin-type N-terminal cleavage/methylation domain-containing protein